MLEQELQFDGFASTTALISLVYGVILLIAAILNIRPPDVDVSAEFLSASGRLVNTTEEGSGRLNQVSIRVRDDARLAQLQRGRGYLHL
jgi:hypothetical protein